MKAVLNFDLNDHDDRMAHIRCVKAEDMASVIFQFSYNAQKSIESLVEQREERDMPYTPLESVRLAFDLFRDLLEERGIIIDELIA